MKIPKSLSVVFLCIFIFTSKIFCQFNFGGFSPFSSKPSSQDVNMLNKQDIGAGYTGSLEPGNNGITEGSLGAGNDPNTEILKQVNQQDSGMGGHSLLEGQDDQSVRELLKSFQVDDTTGNYLHKGDHGGYGETQNSFQEDVLKHMAENPESRDSGPAFNSPTYLVTKEVELFIQYGNSPIGKILIGLFGDTVPKTVANFADLADHKHGFGYRGSIFHRVIKDFMIQGGDITNGDGTGGRSIYGDKFPDENFNIRMNGPGWACMANAGKDTNDSQFFITTADTNWLNGKHVCFGKVLDGMDVVNQVQNVPKNGEKPIEDVKIMDSRSIFVRPFVVSSEPARF